MKFRTIFFILLFVVTTLVLILVIRSLNKSNNIKQKRITDLENAINNSNSRYMSTVYTKDSLFRINAFLSKYRILTEAMTYRDSVTNPLKYKIGDVVTLKIDSSRAVISDIIIGGSKYSYYIKYKILLKDKSTEEIVPELVY